MQVAQCRDIDICLQSTAHPSVTIALFKFPFSSGLAVARLGVAPTRLACSRDAEPFLNP